MLILSVDTSLPVLSVALFADGVLGAVALEGKESRNEKLLPAVDWLLGESGCDRRELKLLAVTRGPGSFTGVRVGLATMQGLGMALQIPAVGLSTHEAASEWRRGRDVIVHGDAGRGESYVSAFRGDEEVLPPVLMRAEELEELKSQFPEAIDLNELQQCANVAVLAAQRASRIEMTERYLDLTPIYVRLAEAEVKLRRG